MMGQKLNETMGRIGLIVILLMSIPLQLASAAANDTSGPGSIIGDPFAAWNKLPATTRDKVTLILGILAFVAMIAGVAALLISSAKTSAGAAVGNVAMRNEGQHNMLIIVGGAIVLVLALGVFWFFMNGGF